MFEELTPEQLAARQKAAALDSVNLLKAGKPESMSEEEWADCVKRNQEHLALMVEKGVLTATEAKV